MVATDSEGHHTGFDDWRDECLDRGECVLDVTGDRGGISVVDRREGSEDLHLLDGVVRSEHRGCRADRLGTEPRAGPERGAAVPRHAEDGGFDIPECLDMGQAGVGTRACEPWSLESVPGLVHESSRVAVGGFSPAGYP